jgi:uncharacterized integral membrane protein
MMQFSFIISMIFAVVIAVFAVANSEPVTLNLIFKSFEMSQAVVILVSAVIGAVIVFMLNLVSKAKSSKKSKLLNKEIVKLKSELEACDNERAKMIVPEQVIEENETV